jgi:error-prone DNA polymerase
VIFMSIEDETGLGNVIVWTKTFEAFRPIVIGARLVRVHGKLQKQDQVIHVVASRIEDLTPRLAELSELGPTISGLSHVDEVKRPVHDRPDSRKPSRRAANMLHDMPDLLQQYEDLAKASAKHMPPGRNFQ